MNQRRWLGPVIGVCVFLSQAKTEQVMYGNVKLYDLTIESSLKIIGVGHIHNIKVLGDVSVYGVLKAQDSELMGNLYVAGSNLALESDTVSGDVQVSNYLNHPKLVLHNSTIHGRVVFKGVRRGCVEMDSSSHIMQGIENGEVCQ